MDETAECPNADIISTLPKNIIEEILCLMPIRDALRTSVLSTKWRYSWRSMPTLTFTKDMVYLPVTFNGFTYNGFANSPWGSHNESSKPDKYKLVSAIFHVLLFHNGPTTLEFDCCGDHDHMESEFAQIISYLAMGNKLRNLIFVNKNSSYKLPVSFFSLQGLEHIYLENCTFEPPLMFNGFSRLKSIAFVDVNLSAQLLQRFLSNCLLLEHIRLGGHQEIDFLVGVEKFVFVDFLRRLPLIKTLDVSKYYMKYLCVDGMPHKLPTSLRLKELILDVCLMEQNEISSALCIIRSSPVLKRMVFEMYDNDKFRQISTNFFNPEGHPDLNLDHLVTLEMKVFSNLPIEMEFVKLIMAKSPVLKKVEIQLRWLIRAGEGQKIFRDLVPFPFPRASPPPMLTIVRQNMFGCRRSPQFLRASHVEFIKWY